MVCRVCGRAIANENANFCEYCGTALNGRGEGYAAENGSAYDQGGAYANASKAYGPRYGNPEPYAYGQADGMANGRQDNSLTGILSGTAATANAEGSMTFLHWIVVLLLPYIPIVGTLAYFILLFVWSFGRTASTTRKNWARATLVMLVVAIVFMSYMLSGLLSNGSFADMLNGIGIS